MKESPQKRIINVKGLERYAITETGNITIAKTGTIMPKCKDTQGKECVFLSFMGRTRKQYLVEDLLQRTYKELYQPYDHLKRNIGLQKVGEFSMEEDDYGSEDGRYMKEIKDQLKLMRRIDRNESDFEQDEGANLE